MKKIILFLGFVLILTACNGNAAASPSLDGSAWTLLSYDDAPLLEGTRFTLAFNDGHISGAAGCNAYGGDYTTRGDHIAFENLYATARACLDAEVMAQEQTLLAFIGAAERWEIREGRLYLFRADGAAMIFAADDSQSP